MTADAQLEATILGAMLLSEAGFTAAAELLPGDFTLDSNVRIFARMKAMHEAGIAVDTVSLTSELTRVGQLESVGGPMYILDLTDGVPRGEWSPAAHVRLLRKASARRQIAALARIAEAQAENGDEPADIFATLGANLLQAQRGAMEVRPLSIAAHVVPAVRELKRLRSANREVLGVPYGIPELDAATTGLRDGEFVLLGAAPGRGKTAFLLQVCYGAALAGIGVGVISLEMRAQALMWRLGMMRSGLSPRVWRDPRLMTLADLERAERSLYELGDLPITMIDQSGLSPAEITNLARQMYDDGARLIVVDFVQIIREEGRDRREAINRVSAALRDLAKTLNVPVLAASQVARGDKDLNRRPTMQDLRESGNLEQDAHCVLMLYRPVDGTEWTGNDEIIIAKQREGMTGHVDVHFDERTLTYRPRLGELQAQGSGVSHGG